jgi:hypothetical protein
MDTFDTSINFVLLDNNDEIYDQNILDSISIAMETYLFNYPDNNDVYKIIKFIYETIANIYRETSLITILRYIKHYYNLNYPNYNEIFDLFYDNIYQQSIRYDNMTVNLARLNSTNIEYSNSNIFNNIINEINNLDLSNFIINNLDISQNNIINNLDISQNNINTLSIYFLSNIFNNQNNITNITNISNLFQNIMNNNINNNINNIDIDTNKYPIETYNNLIINIKQKNSDNCIICQDLFDINTNVKILDCEHCFHPECIDKWLKKCSNLCPICRNNCD